MASSRALLIAATVAATVLAGCGDTGEAGGTDGQGGGGADGVGGGGATGGSGGDGGGAPVEDSCDPNEPRTPATEVVVAPEGFEEAVVDFFDAASTSIDVMMYQFTVQPIAEALIAAKERGVVVRVMLDGEQTVNSGVRDDLTAAGVEVKNAPTSFDHNHAKVAIVDGARAMVASANFNSYSVSSERNFAAFIETPDDIADLAAIFEHDFSGAPLDLSCTRLVVSPENARDRLVALIGSASSTLDLAVMYLSDDEIRFAVEAKAADGVAVRVLLADPGWIDGNADTAAELQAQDIPVRYEMEYGLHAKLIIADDVAFVGSQNYSYTSLEKNREVGLLVTEADPVAMIRATFESDFEGGAVP